MQEHAEMGAHTLQSVADRSPDVGFLIMAIQIAHCHHERWDGTGYPQRLAGEQIPLAARIAAVADVYDALTSPRPYKKAIPHRDAAALIYAGAGTQFEPAVVDAFRACEDELARAAVELADGTNSASNVGASEEHCLAKPLPDDPGAGESRHENELVQLGDRGTHR